jgi:alkanesulfonate monooxygenase SsuD/methylene tetrahydromethanopterin reductase-like flavin-dependent oxidoreductase (luciferase family)
MKVRFGVSVISGTAFPHRRDLDKLAELIRIIDGSGIELIATNDTSFIGGDAYVRATFIAQTATNAQVGIHPTNPLTREPQIMAAFLASIDAMTEGRAFLDIGSGDSAVYNIGLAPASRAQMADYVTCVRDLIATGEGTYDGRPQRVRWHGEAVRKRIPITLCAEGPKTLNLGGQIFDGVIAGTGLLPGGRARGGSRSIRGRGLVHDPLVARCRPRQGDRTHSRVRVLDPQPFDAFRSRRQECPDPVQGQDRRVRRGL